jgi:CheY-like chemotaxis protein
MATQILVVDDSITIQKVVELTFSDSEWQVTCLADGSRLIEKIKEIHPAVLLLDVILPGENGYDLCERIKRDPSLPQLPILLLTGTFEPFDRRRADSVGADGHLTKPFESQVLVSRVQEMLRLARRGRISTDVGYARPINEGEEFTVRSATQPAPAAVEPPRPAATPADLSPAMLDDIARRVAERLGDRLVREIAWEIVPEVAERLVRQRIRDIEEGS